MTKLNLPKTLLARETLDVSALRNAVARLSEGLLRYQSDVSDTQIRDGLVQRFEFTYEQSHKLLKRYLEQTSANPSELDEMSFADLIRTANEKNLLLNNWTVWREYREMRNLTSHTYDEDIALRVVSGIPRFLSEAEHLLASLTRVKA